MVDSSISNSTAASESVSLEIDYQIIEHFSKYLYGSPNKAIEELVANSFDAYASAVHVFLTSNFMSQKVAVWDDGTSMDAAGLKGLWQIANSPKKEDGARIARGPQGDRRIIGKFGIGKLASYTLGDQMTHICRQNGQFLMVSIDYRKVKASAVPEGAGQRVSYRSPIQKLSETEAKTLLAGQFAKVPTCFDEMFKKEHWTFALIEALKPFDLPLGRLIWVLGNGMPLRPDFHVWVNEISVTPKLERGNEAAAWDFGHQDLITVLKTRWEEGKRKGLVSGSLNFNKKVGLDPKYPTREVPYVEFPNLKTVWGIVRLYQDSLEAGRQADQGRSSGFFVMVRERLINPTDDKIFLPEPSFGTFYRSQFILHIDELDRDLLADRERLQQDTPRAKELQVLQGAVYSLARARQESDDEPPALTSDNPRRHHLPTHSRQYFRNPLATLLRRMNDGDLNAPTINLDQLKVLRKDIGEKEPIASLSKDGGAFEVNSLHPYFRTLEDRFGTGKRATEMIREYEALAVSERLFEGYLYDSGLSEQRVNEIVSWREEMYRQLALANEQSPFQISRRMEETSFVGGARFENAIADALNAMGFIAERDGDSGKKDVLMSAPCGERSYTLIFEAKGKKEGALENDKAEISGADAHRQAVGAEFAIVVARKFKGFERNENPMILQECQTSGRVSIVEVEALSKLLDIMHRFSYPLSDVKEVLVAIESPAAKLQRLQKFERPLDHFNYRGLLEAIWNKQRNLTEGEAVPYMTLYYELNYHKNKATFPQEAFKRNIIALATLAYPLVEHEESSERVALRQDPVKIADQIERTLRPPIKP